RLAAAAQQDLPATGGHEHPDSPSLVEHSQLDQQVHSFACGRRVHLEERREVGRRRDGGLLGIDARDDVVCDAGRQLLEDGTVTCEHISSLVHYWTNGQRDHCPMTPSRGWLSARTSSYATTVSAADVKSCVA